ncbi:MAG: DUF4386 family protein [Chloroflexota bacterium]
MIGNRWALVGAIIYLLEWVAILGFGAGNAPSGDPGTGAQAIVSEYKQHALAISLAAGWFSLVLLGRILFVAGIRDALRHTGFRTTLADFALLSMAVSVVLEISAYTIAAGAAHAASGGGQSSVVALDAVANWLVLNIWAPLGASVLSASLAMLLARAFPSWLCWLGMVAGVAGCAVGVINGAAFQQGGALYQAANVLSAVAAIGFWLWMLITAILLFRAAGRPSRERALIAAEGIG